MEGGYTKHVDSDKEIFILVPENEADREILREAKERVNARGVPYGAAITGEGKDIIFTIDADALRKYLAANPEWIMQHI